MIREALAQEEVGFVHAGFSRAMIREALAQEEVRDPMIREARALITSDSANCLARNVQGMSMSGRAASGPARGTTTVWNIAGYIRRRIMTLITRHNYTSRTYHYISGS